MKENIKALNESLQQAVENKETYLIIPLLEKGLSAEVFNKDGNAPVHLSVLKEDINLLKYLIENKANLNLLNTYTKRSALMMAVQGNYEKATSLLVKAGADLDCQDVYKEAAIHVAVRYGYEEISKLLIKRKANLNIQNNKGWTPLIVAIRRGNKKICSWLVEEGTNLALEDQNGWQALTWAADLGHSSLVKMLINAGANINHQDKKGRTALMRAVKNEYTETVFTLLMHNADEKIQDIYGKTALDYAVERGSQESIKLLSLTENLKSKTNQDQKVVAPQKEGVQEAFFDDDGKVFASAQEAKKHQIYQLKTDGKELYLTPISLKKSDHLKKILKDVLLFNLKREKE